MRYPKATRLLALNASTYIGIPLHGQSGAPIGQITLLLDTPLRNPNSCWIC